jgi:hypothetical protein
MNIAFVLGNGISRLCVDLQQLHQYGKIYGCNALYREFIPDVLVATDRPIANAIQMSGYSQKYRFYTRRPLQDHGALTIPQPYYGYSSGPAATAIAALNQHQCIYLLGFDLGPDNTKKFNNVYAGTEFYKPKNSNQTYTGNWIRQIQQITKNFSSIQFVRVHGNTTADISDFQTINNLLKLNMQDFLTKFNLIAINN